MITEQIVREVLTHYSEKHVHDHFWALFNMLSTTKSNQRRQNIEGFFKAKLELFAWFDRAESITVDQFKESIQAGEYQFSPEQEAEYKYRKICAKYLHTSIYQL